MSLKDKIKHFVSFCIHGTPPNITAKVYYLQPNSILINKRIIITGGSRGLGYSMAKKFVAEGADVLITGRDELSLKKSADEIGCKYLVLDMRNIEGFADFIDKADACLKGANVLVNNAGISLHEHSFLEVGVNQYQTQFDTNLKGPFFLTQCFINKTKNRKGGETKKILFTSSETSMTVDERPYGLTKAALNSFVQGIACRYIKDGFRINAIAPGITASSMTGFNPDGNLALDINPTGRVFLPEEIAEVACFLCSDASNILNGQIIYCNEGRTINTRW